MQLTHDQYFDYEALTRALKGFREKFPEFIDLESLGQSKQGREMWLITLTDKSSGAHHSKPAYWVDGNTHAMELAGPQACLFLIDKLLSEKQTNPSIRELLKSFTIYALPRISVDGAEYVLKTAQWVRSSIEVFPEFAPSERFKAQDIDGDNEVSQMRIQDPSGLFKISKKDSRLMVPREPWDDDFAGPYYHILQEGEYLNYDGFHRKQFFEFKFDLNRQSPASFKPTEAGAGPTPMFLEEGRIYSKAIVDRPNIFAINTYHTYGGVLLRPSSLRPDSEFKTFDLELYKKIGEVGTATTGYKALSVFHDFKYDPKEVTTGAWDDWHYDHRGILSWTPEIWNLAAQAGVKYESAVDYYRKLSEDDYIKIISWCDTNLPENSYFKKWVKFDHPQLGSVEIGGWRQLFTITNPPPKFLKKEVEMLAEFSIKQILLGPKIEITKAVSESIEADLFRIKIEVRNSGFLPTYFTEQRKSLPLPQMAHARLQPSGSQKIIQGKMEQPLNHLLGRSRAVVFNSAIWADASSNPHEEQLVWIVKGRGPVEVTLDYAGAGVRKVIVQC